MEKDEKYLMVVALLIVLLCGLISGYHYARFKISLDCINLCEKAIKELNCVCLGNQENTFNQVFNESE